MKDFNNTWAIILGGSGGFGFATAKYLASKGMNIFIVHRDSRSSLENVKRMFDELSNEKIKFDSLNINACDPSNFNTILKAIKKNIKDNEFAKVFIHSISDGNINDIFDNENNENQLSVDDFQHTINTMGLNFLEWSKLLVFNKVLVKSSRIIGITSEGSDFVLPYYAAVASAKATLESLCKYMAVKFAPLQITVNLIKAGITETKALAKFPNYDELISNAKRRNPSGRLTQPDDIAKAIYLLSLDESSWITGEIIRVDGGEQLISLY